MAAVRIEEEAFCDARIDLLGTLAGYNRFEALGRLSHLWRVCTQKQTHVLSEAIVTACIGPAGAQHMVDAELAERVADGIRVRGTAGRIEWLGELRAKRQEAGRARMKDAKRDGAGRLLASTPAHGGPAPSTRPAKSSALTPALTPTSSIPDPEEEPEAAPPRARKAPTGPQAEAIAQYSAYYSRSHAGAQPTLGKQHFVNFAKLVSKHGLPEIVRRISVLEQRPPPWPPSPWDASTFLQHFDKIAGAAGTAKSTGRVEPGAEGTYPEGDIAL